MSGERQMLTFSFPDPDAADAAYGEVKHLHGIHQAARVERDAEGTLTVPDSWVHRAGVPTVGVGLAGGLIGLVGGPLGALIGWVAGTLLAGAAEDETYRHAAEALTVLEVDLPTPAHAVLAELAEADPSEADELAARHGATVARRSAEAVKESVRSAEEAADREIAAERAQEPPAKW